MIALTSGESTMAHLKLFVLGQPRLERDGEPVELNLRKALALLAYLAVSAQPHSRDALATLLWPESDQREGRARLRRNLHRLTQAIGDDVLDSTPEAIRLYAHADLWLDSAAFRQHATAGLAAPPQEAFAPQRLAHLDAAVALYTEDFLAGFTLPDNPAFDEWQFFQRESLRQLYGQVLEQLVQAYRGQQDWGQAIAYARKWVALDGLHEPAHRMLMRLYAWAGQHTAALRQYQECVRLLRAELGMEPEDETTALYEGIRTRQLAMPEAADHQPLAPLPAALEAPPPVSLGALGNALPRGVRHAPAPGTALVGRKRERAEIAALLRQDDVRLVTLTGPGGVGKTRLALAVADAAQATFADEVVFVGLQALSDATLVLPTIAQALEVMEQGGQRLLTSVQTALQDRQVLLVLDNFEQVLAAGVQVAELLGVPTLKVLVTSRAALRLQAEHVIIVDPLAAPRPPHCRWTSYPGMRRCSSSSLGHRRQKPTSRRPPRMRRQWPRSVPTWMGCPWPLSWPRPVCESLPQGFCYSVWGAASKY
jgi:DNA-binding SARP family transcriptional activator